MINLEKIKRKSVTPLPLRRPTPAPYFQALFLIFQILPPLAQVIKTYSPPPPIKREGEGARTMSPDCYL